MINVVDTHFVACGRVSWSVWRLAAPSPLAPESRDTCESSRRRLRRTCSARRSRPAAGTRWSRAGATRCSSAAAEHVRNVEMQVTCYKQRWTLGVINWRWSSVERSWQRLRRSTSRGDRKEKNTPPLGKPHWNFIEVFGIRKPESCAISHLVCARDPTFSRYGRTPTCDGRTDRQMDRHSLTGPQHITRYAQLRAVKSKKVECGPMPNVMATMPNIGAVTLSRRETRRNLPGCPKLPNGSRPLVSWSSPYCEGMCRRYCCF